MTTTPLSVSDASTKNIDALASRSPIAPEIAVIDGLEIRYARGSNRSGAAVLLTSPWPESLYAYQSLWATLNTDFSLLAIDLPGFGQSEGRGDLMSPRAMCQFVVRVADHFDLDRPHVIAPDVGTPTMLFAAAEHPARFRSLVIGGGASTYPLQVADILKNIIEAQDLAPYRALDPAVVVRNAVSQIRNYVVPDFVREDYVESYAGTRFVDSMAFVRQYPAELQVLASLLPNLTTPIQIIAGRNDPEVPIVDAERLHQLLPNSVLNILECGHNAWEEEADEFGRIASAWLNGGYERVGH